MNAEEVFNTFAFKIGDLVCHKAVAHMFGRKPAVILERILCQYSGGISREYVVTCTNERGERGLQNVFEIELTTWVQP